MEITPVSDNRIILKLDNGLTLDINDSTYDTIDGIGGFLLIRPGARDNKDIKLSAIVDFNTVRLNLEKV